ncbi:MAG TPA: HAMP domain-containing sensor histidine kinase [Phycisphaerae bacterium]
MAAAPVASAQTPGADAGINPSQSSPWPLNPSGFRGLWQSIDEFLNNAMNTSDFPPRWTSGNWSPQHGWLHIISDLAIWTCYTIFPLVLFFCVRKNPGVPYARLLWMFGACIMACGATHLLDALLFWWPAYRFVGLVKAGAALATLITTIWMLPVIPRAMVLRSPAELQREIFQRRRTEAELRQVHAQLEGVIEQRTMELASKNEEMEQFLNTVSHDLKSPVVTCLGLTRMMRDDIEAGHIAESKDCIDRIDRSVNRMRQLIDDLLNLSRIGKVSFDVVDIPMASLMSSIADELRPRLEQAGVVLQIDDNLPIIRGDAHWLTEVFENLVINALKYGCDNPHPRIVVGASDSPDEHRLFVCDNGRGIDPAQHLHIFEPFRRLRSEKEGSGMGLAIVARIVKMHGGRAWVESQVGAGATFWVSLPMAKRPDAGSADASFAQDIHACLA